MLLSTEIFKLNARSLLRGKWMEGFADMLVVTHIPYMLLTAVLVLELWWLRRKLRKLSRRLMVN